MKHEVRSASSLSPQTLESLVLRGDLSGLSPTQKVEYACYRAQQLGLDPAAKPFEIMRLNGKEVLYATAGLTQQLCASQNLSVSFPVPSERIEDVVMVTARVTDPKGRSTENVGAVTVGNLKSEGLANALMKCRTKAMRRAVLSHCGLGMLDETEEETLTAIEVIRPGDAQPVIEPDPDGWTEEERDMANADIADFAEATCEAGWDLENPKIQATIKKFRGEIGQGTYANWKNRLVLAAERACKAAPKASPSTPQTADSGDHSQKTSESDCSPSSSTVSPLTLESMTDEALGKLVSEQWFKVYEAWNKTTADGRMLQERHKQNRVTKRIGEWAPGLKQGSREWLLAVAEGQLKEVADAN